MPALQKLVGSRSHMDSSSQERNRQWMTQMLGCIFLKLNLLSTCNSPNKKPRSNEHWHTAAVLQLRSSPEAPIPDTSFSLCQMQQRDHFHLRGFKLQLLIKITDFLALNLLAKSNFEDPSMNFKFQTYRTSRIIPYRTLHCPNASRAKAQPGQVASSSQGSYMETHKHTHSHAPTQE